MDREVKEHYQVVIQAKDMAGQMGGLSGTTTVSITLLDVNDNPPRFIKSEYEPSGLQRTRSPLLLPGRQAAPIWCQFQNESGLLQGALGCVRTS